MVQRFGWAILDSRAVEEDDPEIVRNNITLASRYYTNGGHEVTTDPNTVADRNVRATRLHKGEPLHIHGHGTDVGLGGFGADSLAREVKRKFRVDELKGRIILLHACAVGSGNFLNAFVQALASNNLQGWDGTTVLGPVRFLVVNPEGISQVSRPGIRANQLTTRESQSGKLLKKGEGWAGVQVVNNNLQNLTALQAQEHVQRNMKRG